jgi:pimeloyl-ACP methyl ester carboxylesterase
VLCGTLDPVTPATGRRCATLMPNCHLVLVYAAGPTIGLDRPEAFAEVVGDFLERHEGFVVTDKSGLLHP